MTTGLEIRESEPGDLASIEALYPDAFPDEDLLPLVRNLLHAPAIARSLVGTMSSLLVGHVIFTRCGVTGSQDEVALLGPLAVAPARQRQGIGSALVRFGLLQLGQTGVTRVYVLGDPAYYGRLDFLPEIDIAPPYALPVEWRGAWQSMTLGNAETPRKGKLSVPEPWRQPALWST